MTENQHLLHFVYGAAIAGLYVLAGANAWRKDAKAKERKRVLRKLAGYQLYYTYVADREVAFGVKVGPNNTFEVYCPDPLVNLKLFFTDKESAINVMTRTITERVAYANVQNTEW